MARISRGTFTRLIPPTPLSRRLATQSLLFALAEGTFNTGSAVFFTQLVGLSAAQVGLGLTIAGLVSFVVALPAGKLADRYGPKRMWAIGAGLSGLTFLAWPFIHGFGGYAAMAVVLQILENAAGAGRNAYVIDVMPPKERVETQAYMYSSLNVGFTLGAIVGGVALAFDSDSVLRAVPVLTAIIGVCNAVWISRLPKAPHDLRVAERKRGEKVVKPPGRGAMRNPGWMFVSLFTGTQWTNQVLLNIVIPLWLVQETDAPHVLLAWLFGTNTVLCIFLPAYTSKGVRDPKSALRSIRLSTVFFVGSCVITMFTHSTVGFVTIVLVWLGHVTVTGAELYLSAASWSFQSDLVDPLRRGEYNGVQEVFSVLGSRWAPAVYTFLAVQWDGLGWLAIAGIVVVATVGLHPAVRSAERFLQRELAEREAYTQPTG